MKLRDKILEAVSAARSAIHASRKTRVISAAALGLTLIAFGAAGVAPLAPDASDLPVKQLVEELALPDLSEQIARLSPASQQFVMEERVRAGDTLATLMERLGVNDPQAAAFIKSNPSARALLNLRPGRRVQAIVAANGQLLSASALLNDGKNDPKKLVIARTNNGFAANLTAVVLEYRSEMRSGEIRSSLFAATDAAQVPDAVAMQIVEMFSADIDFASDLRRGDRFNVVYETVWLGGEFVRSGRVLAAEFRNDGKTWQAVWFNNPASKESGYFDLHGKSLKKAFLKSPLQFSRVTSGFTMRVHPISGLWKQHKGIDFAAATGTPIRAAGDGIVDFAGIQGGYGNVVVLQHGSVYSTAYAHMSRMASGVRRGARVTQGEVIGYVGTTGWSTGPHLHYEFRVNNAARDPNSIVVPHTQALAGLDLQRFRTVAVDMAHRFTLLSPQSVQVATR